MSFSINSDYYNIPRMNRPSQIIQEEKIDENGIRYVEERIVPDIKMQNINDSQGGRIASVPFITGAAYDYQ